MFTQFHSVLFKKLFSLKWHFSSSKNLPLFSLKLREQSANHTNIAMLYELCEYAFTLPASFSIFDFNFSSDFNISSTIDSAN